MKHIALAAALAAAVAACALPAPGPDLHDFAKLVPGQSTAQDAVALLGRPISATVIGENAYVQWLSQRNGSYGMVGILFDARGRMIRVQHIVGL